MTKAAKKEKTYRHAPAFILLFLARRDSYGAGLLKAMQSEIPYCFADSAVIYRKLQELEKEGAVESYWETDISGPAKKWYKITNKGLEVLEEFKEDIERRIKNLEFFLTTYKNI